MSKEEKVWTRLCTLDRYLNRLYSWVLYSPKTCRITNQKSLYTRRAQIPICWAICSIVMKASYSASLLDARNPNRKAIWALLTIQANEEKSLTAIPLDRKAIDVEKPRNGRTKWIQMVDAWSKFGNKVGQNLGFEGYSRLVCDVKFIKFHSPLSQFASYLWFS